MKKLLLSFLFLWLMISITTLDAQSHLSAASLPPGDFFTLSQNGVFLGPQYSSPQNGELAWPFNEPVIYQIIPTSDGYYKIVDAANQKALCVFGASDAEEEQIHHWTYSPNNQGDQEWKFLAVGRGAGRVVVVNRKSGKCLSRFTRDGAPFRQKSYYFGPGQWFDISGTSESFPEQMNSIEHGKFYYLVNSMEGYSYLENNGDSPKFSGSRDQAADQNYQWLFELQQDGAYKLKNLGTGKYAYGNYDSDDAGLRSYPDPQFTGEFTKWLAARAFNKPNTFLFYGEQGTTYRRFWTAGYHDGNLGIVNRRFLRDYTPITGFEYTGEPLEYLHRTQWTLHRVENESYAGDPVSGPAFYEEGEFYYINSKADPSRFWRANAGGGYTHAALNPYDDHFRWRFEADGDGFRFVNKATANGLETNYSDPIYHREDNGEYLFYHLHRHGNPTHVELYARSNGGGPEIRLQNNQEYFLASNQWRNDPSAVSIITKVSDYAAPSIVDGLSEVPSLPQGDKYLKFSNSNGTINLGGNIYKLDPLGANSYKVFRVGGTWTETALGASSDAPTQMTWGSYSGATEQHWQLHRTNDDHYILTNALTGEHLSHNYGSSILSLRGFYDGDLNLSKFEIVDLAALPNRDLPSVALNGQYMYQYCDSRMYYSTQNENEQVSTPFYLYNENEHSEEQVFKFEAVDDRYFTVRHVPSNRLFSVENASSSAGARLVLLNEQTGAPHQQWEALELSVGFCLRNRLSGLIATGKQVQGNYVGTQEPFVYVCEQIIKTKSFFPAAIRDVPALTTNYTRLESHRAEHNGNVNLAPTSAGSDDVIAPEFRIGFNDLFSELGFDIAVDLGTIQVTTVEHLPGNPSGLNTSDTHLAYPTTHISGYASLLGEQVNVDLRMSVAGSGPLITLALTYENAQGDNALSLSSSKFNFINNIPGLNSGIPGGDIKIADLKVIFTNFERVNDADYGFAWNKGMNVLGKMYFKDDAKSTANTYLNNAAEIMACDEFKMHLAVDISSGVDVLVEMEAVTEMPITPLDNFWREERTIGGSPHMTLVYNDWEDFTMKMISAGGSVQLVSGSGSSPTLELGLTTQMQVAFDEPIADRGGQKTVLQFKANPKIRLDQTPGIFQAGSLEKAGFAADGILTGNEVNPVWNNPFGLPNSAIQTAALQYGFTATPPYIESFGIAGSGTFFGKSGRFGLGFDLNDPEKLIALLTIDELNALEAAALAFGGPLAVAGAAAAQDALPSSVEDFINSVIDVKFEDVHVSVIQTPGKIGEIQFTQKGYTVHGRTSLWGWNAYMKMHYDDSNGLMCAAHIDPFTWDINGTTVFGLEGQSGNTDVMQEFVYDSQRYTWETRDVSIGDKPHFSLTLPIGSSSQNAQMQLAAEMILFNQRIPMSFDISGNMEIEQDFSLDFAGSNINGALKINGTEMEFTGSFDLDLPAITIPSFRAGTIDFPDLTIADFDVQMNDSRIYIKPTAGEFEIRFGSTSFDITALGQTVNIDMPSFAITNPLLDIDDLVETAAEEIKEHIIDNAADLIGDWGDAIETTLFNSDHIRDYKFVFYEGDDCTQAAYAWDELANASAYIDLDDTRPAASIPDNGSSVFFESNLTTKDDEIRSIYVLPGTDGFWLTLYSDANNEHPKMNVIDRSATLNTYGYCVDIKTMRQTIGSAPGLDFHSNGKAQAYIQVSYADEQHEGKISRLRLQPWSQH